MRRTRRLELTVETDRIIMVVDGGSEKLWCPVCQSDTQMISVDQAAILQQVNARTIFRWVDEGRLHYAETAQGLLRICLNSLP